MKLIIFFALCNCFRSSYTLTESSTFFNPILERRISQFSFGRVEDFYYLVVPTTDNLALEILQSPFLSDFRFAKKKVIYKAQSGYSGLVATSSLFQHKGQLYLYFYMTDPVKQTVFVMKADEPNNPMGTWRAPIRLVDQVWDKPASIGSVLQIDEQLYFAWTSPEPSNASALAIYMAQMTSPTELREPVLLLREPSEEWECEERCIAEAPTFIQNREIVYLVYSASDSERPGGCLSYMSIQTGQDPMNAANWIPVGHPAFVGSEDESAFSPVFPKFVTSPDGTETWLVYSASSNLSNIVPERTLRIDKMAWNITTGAPIFPLIHGSKSPQGLPSGEPPVFKNPVFSVPLNTNTHNSLYWDGSFYYLVLPGQNDTTIELHKSNTPTDFDDAEIHTVFSAPDGMTVYSNVFPYNGEIYIYLTMQGDSRGIYYSKAANPLDITQQWTPPTPLLIDVWNSTSTAYGAAVMHHDGVLYLLWTMWDSVLSLYIAKMDGPTKVVPPAVLLRQPHESRECFINCVAEFPHFIYKNNVTHMIFSSGGFGIANSSLTYMSIESGRDPLYVSNWYTFDGPVLSRNDEEGIYAPYYPMVTNSPDGKETWLLYHGAASASGNESDLQRTLRLDKIEWNPKNGKAMFPKPHGLSHPQPIPSKNEYFSNPILGTNTSSPGIFKLGSFYYMTLSENSNTELVILKSGQLTNFSSAERRTVYRTPSGYGNLLAPKLHQVGEKLCIYFSMQFNDNAYDHRLFVVTSEDATNPLGRWGTPTRLSESTWSQSSFHPTVVEHSDKTYLAWISLRPATGLNSIYIAEMENATHVKEPIVLIREPRESWECEGGCSDAAPFAIHNEDKTYIVHSVGASCGGANGLTWMSIEKDKDPLDVLNWIQAPDKVFGDNEQEGVFCPGHATFTKSPDDQETWMVFHASDSRAPDAEKHVHIEKISWNADGYPKFAEPHGVSTKQIVPAKKRFYYHNQ